MNRRMLTYDSGAAAAAFPLPPADRGWDPLLVAVAAYLLTAVGRVHQLFAFLTPLPLALTAAALAIGLWLWDTRRVRRAWPTLALPSTKLILGLALWMALSVPGALWPGGSFVQFVNFAKTAAMYFVIVSAVRGMRDIERLAGVYFIGAAVYSALVLMRFPVNAEAWRLAGLYYYDANDFATFAVSALPIGLYFTYRPGWTLRRLGAAAGLGVLGVGIVRSGSRGGFLALLSTILYLLFCYKALRPLWRVLIVGMVAFLIFAVASDRYWEQMRTITSPGQDYNSTEEAGRLNVWKRGMGYMFGHPLLGVGADNFSTAEGTLSPQARRAEIGIGKGVRWTAPHSSFIQTGAELGIPGLALFIGIIAAAFRALRNEHLGPQWTTNRAKRSPLAQSLTAALVGFTVGASFLSLAYADMFYALVALAAAVRKVSHSQQLGPQPWHARKSTA